MFRTLTPKLLWYIVMTVLFTKNTRLPLQFSLYQSYACSTRPYARMCYRTLIGNLASDNFV